MCALVSSKDAKAKVFVRPGKDGGQDARSGDDRTVYQAKHHASGSGADVIRDAKAEAEKIVKYKESTHERSGQWRGVDQWVLVTDVALSVSDEERWRLEVVPVFKRLQLEADFWDQGRLDSRLDGVPHIEQAFFGGKSRVFLTLPEARERVELDAPFFSSAMDIAVKGRADDLEKFRTFLEADQPFLVVSGPGGVGKTRFLLEAGVLSSSSWQVLWGNLAAMENPDWFPAIIPEQPTLLLVDDPEDEKVLQLLVEQVGGTRTSKWKVVVAVRSPKDSVIEFLHHPRMNKRRTELPLLPLDASAAREVCLALFEAAPSLRSQADSWKDLAIRKIASLSRYKDGHLPVWMVMCVHVLQQHQELSRLPETSTDFAAAYLKEAYVAQGDYKPEKVETLVRWIALLGAVNREDQSVLDFLSRRSGFEDQGDLKRCLKSLVRRQVLVQWGAWDRQIELKPDVIRDHVLRIWLIEDDGFGQHSVHPAKVAKDLAVELAQKVRDGEMDRTNRKILRSLARTEWIERNPEKEVELLDPFFKALCGHLPQMKARARQSAVEILVDIAVPRPSEVLAVVKYLREQPCEPEVTETFLGSRTCTQADVVSHLAWTAYHAAMGAHTDDQRQTVTRELCRLVEAEIEQAIAEKRTIPNDGKRAEQLLDHLLKGGPQFRDTFEAEGVVEGKQLLEDFEKGKESSPGRQKVLSAIVRSISSVDRHSERYEGNKIIMESYLIVPGTDPRWRAREELLGALKRILARTTLDVSKRIGLWDLLIEAHRSASFGAAQLRDQQQRDAMRDVLFEDLQWAKQVFMAGARPLQEIRTARQLWDWHYRFDPDERFKTLATELEQLYLQRDLTREFGPICDEHDFKLRTRAAKDKAESLLGAANAGEIEAFVSRASEYLGEGSRIHRVFSVAAELGARAPNAPSVAAFVRASLAMEPETARFDFAAHALLAWLGVLRGMGESECAGDLAVDFVRIPLQDAGRVRLLQRLYEGRSPTAKNLFRSREYDLIRSSAPLFLAMDAGPTFLDIVGWTFGYEWQAYKKLVEDALERMPSGHLPRAIACLSEAIHRGIVGLADHRAEIPSDLGVWLLDQLLRLPELDSYGVTDEWYFGEILKSVPRPDIVWLLAALERRMEMEQKGLCKSAFPVHPLSRYIRPIVEADLEVPMVRSSVEKLLELIVSNSGVFNDLHLYARDVDPNGLVVPTIVAGYLQSHDDPDGDKFWRWARIGGAYFPNSAPWRMIAREVCRHAIRANERTRSSLFSSLRMHQHVLAYVGSAVEHFGKLVETARQDLEAATDMDIKPFWEWNLFAAECELKHWTELEKETDKE